MRFLSTTTTIITIATPFIIASALLAGGPIVALKGILIVHALGVLALVGYAAVSALTKGG